MKIEKITQAQLDKLIAERDKYEYIIEQCHARLDDAGIADGENFDKLYKRLCTILDNPK